MLDTQLSSKDRHHDGRSLRQIFWKRADVASGAELYREAKPIVITSVERDKATVAVIKMKVAGEIFWCRLAVKSAIPPPLLIC